MLEMTLIREQVDITVEEDDNDDNADDNKENDNYDQ